jgi:hypothetical protein
MSTAPLCRWCATALRLDEIEGHWLHLSTGLRGCRDLMGNRRRAMPTRTFIERHEPKA